MENVLICFHSQKPGDYCIDGIAATSFLVRYILSTRKQPVNIVLMLTPAQMSNELAKKLVESENSDLHVYFLDLSFTSETRYNLMHKFKHCVIIDHHAKSMLNNSYLVENNEINLQDYKKNQFTLVNTKYCATTLVSHCFYDKISALAQHVEDLDLGRGNANFNQKIYRYVSEFPQNNFVNTNEQAREFLQEKNITHPVIFYGSLAKPYINSGTLFHEGWIPPVKEILRFSFESVLVLQEIQALQCTEITVEKNTSWHAGKKDLFGIPINLGNAKSIESDSQELGFGYLENQARNHCICTIRSNGKISANGFVSGLEKYNSQIIELATKIFGSCEESKRFANILRVSGGGHHGKASFSCSPEILTSLKTL